MKIRGSTQIMPDTVTPEILENFPSGTVLGNTSGVTATPQYVTFAQLVEETGAITELTGDVTGTGPGIASTLISSGVVTTEKLATLDHINLSLTPSGEVVEGSFQWNQTDGTLDIGLPYGVTLQVGQEMPLPAFNDTGATIEQGVPVYISGRQGHIPEITPARSDSSSTSCIFGITTSTFGTTGDLRYGFVTVFGYVRKIKTNYSGTGNWGTTWAENDKLYVSKTIAGQLTNVEPTSPHHSDVVATVAIVGALGTGSILVINQKHMTLEELTDVDGTPLATDGQFPVWNQGSGYFDFNYNINDYLLGTTASGLYLKLDGSNDPITGDILIKPSTDSLTGFVVQDKDANPVLTVDTINNTVSSVKVNTESNILAANPSIGATAYGTDTQFFYIADGTNWRRASLKFYTDSANPDMGYIKNSSEDGYYATFITDKYLYNVILQGYNGIPVNGAIRINTINNPDTFEIYMRDTGWYTVIYDLTTTYGDFRHTPINEQIYVWRGDSVAVGLNGQPVVQEYEVSMGAYPSYKILNGGTF